MSLLIPGPLPEVVELALQFAAESHDLGLITAEELAWGQKWILDAYAAEVLGHGAGGVLRWWRDGLSGGRP